MKYRTEIDGLRALAVVPVILFHAGVSRFSGGFVGVDVFFVISGYLITSIIIDDIEKDRFSIKSFYERRARRILPALFTVMALCIPFAWLWLPPLKFADFFQSVVSVLFFASNLLFWREADYFDHSADEKPLLHTWSLAVEEQYYVVFPLLLLLLWRFGRRATFTCVALLGLLSLALSEWGWRHQPTANFYLAPFRAWELLAGSLCAFVLSYRPPRPSELASVAGIALIIAAIFLFDERTPFPSLFALAPVGGTALIILYATQTTWCGRLLSTSPFVGIGLISYSAYLWHQPLLAFARARTLHEPPAALMIGLALLSLPLAYLTWKYVEAPYRKAGHTPAPAAIGHKRLPIWPLGAAAAALLAVATGSLHGRALLYSNDRSSSEIINVTGLADACESVALIGCSTKPAPRVLVWGDSYAMQIVPAVVEILKDRGVAQYTKSACNPILGLAPLPVGVAADWPTTCMQFNREVGKVLDANPSIDTVIVSTPMNNLVNGPYVTADGRTFAGGDTREVIARFASTIGYLHNRGLKVVLVSPPPWPSYGLAGDCARKEILLKGRVRDCNFERGAISPESLRVQGLFADMLRAVPADRAPTFIDLTRAFCSETICRAGQGEDAFYGNGGHLSMNGAMALVRSRYFVESLRG